MPKMHIEGFMTGSIQPELSGSSTIHSSSGFTATIDYSGKGWLGGTRNSFKAKLFRDGCDDKPLYIADGQWSCAMNIKDMKTQQISVFDVRSVPRTPLTIAPLEKQSDMESRKAWQHVVAGIEAGDIFAVGHEKSKLENQQREMRKLEKAEGREYQRKYFKLVESDPVAEKLAKGFKDIDLNCNGAGSWLWDEEKVRARSDSGVWI